MRASLPVFYRIIITQELADAVIGGFSPAEPTEVKVLLPPISQQRMLYGLSDVEARKPILKVLENMKDFMMLDVGVIPKAWERFINTENLFVPSVHRGIEITGDKECANENVDLDA